jgi:HSP20 family protein
MFGIMPRRREENVGRPMAHPFGILSNEFRPLFERFWGRLPAVFETPEWTAENFWNLEVTERENEVLVRAEVPGFEVADFELRLAPEFPNGLVIRAEHKVPAEGTPEPERTVPRRLYERMVTLPTAVDAERAEATYRNGVLEVHLPRVREPEARRIPVRL